MNPSIRTEPVDEEGQALHEEAERILAQRNRARGKAAGDYSAEDYLTAIEEARGSSAIRAAELQEALGQVEEVVTQMRK